MLFLFVTIENERGNNNGKDHLYKEQLLDRQSIGLRPLSPFVWSVLYQHTLDVAIERVFFSFFLFCCDMLSNIYTHTWRMYEKMWRGKNKRSTACDCCAIENGAHPLRKKETRSIVVVFQIKMWRHWRLTCFFFLFSFLCLFYFCLRAIRWAIWVRQRITRLPRPLQLHHYSSSIKEAAILISASHHRPTWAFHLTNSIRKRQEPWVKSSLFF